MSQIILKVSVSCPRSLIVSFTPHTKVHIATLWQIFYMQQ